MDCCLHYIGLGSTDVFDGYLMTQERERQEGAGTEAVVLKRQGERNFRRDIHCRSPLFGILFVMIGNRIANRSSSYQPNRCGYAECYSE